MIATINDVYRTAVHELGHLAVSVALSIPAERIEVECTATTRGKFWYTEAATRLIRAGKANGSVCQIALGGPLALFFLDHGKNINPATVFDWSSNDPDVCDAREAAAKMTTGIIDRDALLARSSVSAYGHILRHWAAIKSAADWMLANGLRLNAKQIPHFFR